MGEGAPQLSVLTTSREALGIHGERTYPLPPLELPVDESPFEVEASEAGALFTTRAHDARGTFAVTEENAASIADLCAHLDGNTLAIELAAEPRTAMMSPSEILSRLDQRFRLLKSRSGETTERHQTLHAAIDWSYTLLDHEEKTLLQWLSVVVGDFDLAAATAVAAPAGLDELDAVDRLGSLVAKSLVERSEMADVSRYRLLETIRQYAAEQLDTEENTRRARNAHASHYLASARGLFAMLKTPRDFEALEQLRVETPNLAAGLRWLLGSDHLPEVLGFFADAGGFDTGLVPFVLLDELGRLADEALGRDGASQARGYVEAAFYAGIRAMSVGDWDRYQEVGLLGIEADPDSPIMLGLRMGEASMRADVTSALSMGNAAVEQSRRSDDPSGLSFMLSLLALVELAVDPTQGLTHAKEAVEVARRSPATSTLIYPLCQLSIAAAPSDPDLALAAAEECIGLDQTHRKTWSTLSEGTIVKLRLDRGELGPGLELWRDLLHRLHWSGEVFFLGMQLPGLADSIAGIDPRLALELAAISESGVIFPFAAFDAPGFERLANNVHQLGPDALQAARSRAAAMSYDDAIQYVFDGIDRLIAETANDQRRAAQPKRSS